MKLFDIYFFMRQKTGWLADCKEAGYSREDIEFLEKLDDEMRDYQPARDANEWASGICKKGGHEIISCESDDERVALLTQRIAGLYLEMEKLITGPYVIVIIRREELRRLEKIRNSFRAHQVHTTNHIEGMDSRIARAREFPLEKLVTLEGRLPYIVCPFHDDTRPSMLVKNGFGYCFSCGAWTDSIKWLMTQKKMAFREAVEELCR